MDAEEQPEPRCWQHDEVDQTERTDVFRCPECKFCVDTPNHYYGCKKGRGWLKQRK